MEERWKAVVEGCKAIATGNRPTNRYNRLASQEIMKVGTYVPAKEVVDTVLAMYLLQELDPRRFRSDTAFWTQLVRRVRGLTSLNTGRWASPKTGKVKTASKDLAPRVTEAVAFYLREALGGAGVSLAHVQRVEEERKRDEKLAFYEQLRELA